MPIHADKRASPRVPVKIPLVVEGRDVRHKPVHEITETLLINDGGALIALAAEFQLHDRFRITNKNTGGLVEGRVAWRSTAQIQGRWSYGVALIDPPENFWGIAVQQPGS
jgi:hypothetical protein